jgi:hypothetical protein
MQRFAVLLLDCFAHGRSARDPALRGAAEPDAMVGDSSRRAMFLPPRHRVDILSDQTRDYTAR